MPKIRYSQRDFQRGRVVEPGWYVMEIQSVGEASSKDGQSTNYPTEGIIIKNAENGSEEFKGAIIEWNFNSKVISFSMGFLRAFNLEPKPDVDYELASAVGKRLEVMVENGEWNGRIVNRVNHKYRALRTE